MDGPGIRLPPPGRPDFHGTSALAGIARRDRMQAQGAPAAAGCPGPAARGHWLNAPGRLKAGARGPAERRPPAGRAGAPSSATQPALILQVLDSHAAGP